MEDNKKVDYMASINKARRRRSRPSYAVYAGIVVACILLLRSD